MIWIINFIQCCDLTAVICIGCAAVWNNIKDIILLLASAINKKGGKLLSDDEPGFMVKTVMQIFTRLYNLSWERVSKVHTQHNS